TLKNFETLFHQTNFGSWIVNTMTIAAWVAVITLLTAVPAGYALARLKLPGSENIGIAIFMTYLVPGIILFLPLSRVVALLGLQDSWWALVVVYPTFTIPFCTWLMMGFFKTVPMEMEEAARVDGCGQFGALIRIVLPVSLPGVLTSVIFAFTLSMQDFLYGLAFVSPGDQKPVPVGVPTALIPADLFFCGSAAPCSSGARSWRRCCWWDCRWRCSTIPSSTGSSRASRAASANSNERGLGPRNRFGGKFGRGSEAPLRGY